MAGAKSATFLLISTPYHARRADHVGWPGAVRTVYNVLEPQS